MYTLISFATLISRNFYLMERVSDSSEDPFEGGLNDVPVFAMCRNIKVMREC